MTENPHFVDVDERMTGRQLFNSGLFIRQAVVPQVAVAVVVIPLGPVGMASPVPHRDDHKTELSEAGKPPVGGEGFGDTFGLRPGVNISDNGIFFGFIKIKRLMHDTEEVGHAVIGLDFECFRKLVSRFHQKRQISGFQVQQMISLVVAKNRLGHCVHTREIIHEITPAVVHGYGMIEVPRVEQFKSCPVKIDPVEVHIIRVFSLFPAARVEKQHPVFFIHSGDIITMERTGCDLVFQLAVPVIQIKMAPSVSFRPVDDFPSVVNKGRGDELHVSVQSFFDQGLGFSCGGFGDADVDTVEIPAGARKI